MSQCGFEANRGTTDMAPRQTQEKCREQTQGLFIIFVDLTEAFDTMSRKGLWKILGNLGCPPKFLAKVIELYEDQLGQQSLTALQNHKWHETGLCYCSNAFHSVL